MELKLVELAHSFGFISPHEFLSSSAMVHIPITHHGGCRQVGFNTDSTAKLLDPRSSMQSKHNIEILGVENCVSFLSSLQL